MKALERATGHLQARVGREVTLRRTPRLRFAYDESFDKGAPHRAAARRA